MKQEPNLNKIYPRTNDFNTVYLKNVITKPNIIVDGMPVKIIRKRFEDSVIEDLLKIQWWNWNTEKISKNLSAIRSGDIEALK